jgi:hypothetical protein
MRGARARGQEVGPRRPPPGTPTPPPLNGCLGFCRTPEGPPYEERPYAPAPDTRPPTFEWLTIDRAADLETSGEVERLVSGTLLDGIWRIVTNFPASAPAGAYRLDYVGVTDLAGNGGPVHAPELEARGLEAGFTKLP